MDYKKVNELLEKYFDGETSLQEETMLSTYFNENEVAADLQQYQPLFQYFKEEQAIQLSDDFENRLATALEKLEAQPTEAKIKKMPFISQLRRIAAAAVIIFGAFMAYQQINQPPAEEDLATNDKFAPYDAMTEQEAYERTKAALMLISNKLNTSTQKAAKGFIEVRNATNKVKLK